MSYCWFFCQSRILAEIFPNVDLMLHKVAGWTKGTLHDLVNVADVTLLGYVLSPRSIVGRRVPFVTLGFQGW